MIDESLTSLSCPCVCPWLHLYHTFQGCQSPSSPATTLSSTALPSAHLHCIRFQWTPQLPPWPCPCLLLVARVVGNRMMSSKLGLFKTKGGTMTNYARKEAETSTVLGKPGQTGFLTRGVICTRVTSHHFLA